MCPVCADENEREKVEEDKLKVKVKEDVMLYCVENFSYLGDVIGAPMQPCKTEVVPAYELLKQTVLSSESA